MARPRSSNRARPPTSSPSRSAPAWPRRPWPPPSTASRSTSTRPLADGADGRRASPPTPTPVGPCSATPPPTCWPRPSSGCGRGPTTPSARSSRTASTTTSSCPAAPTSATTTSSGSRPPCARSWPRTSRSSATSTRSTRGWPLFADQPFKREIIEAVGAGHDEVDAAADRRAASDRPVSTYWNSPDLHRPVPGPPRAVDRRLGHFALHAGGRRLLAGRREAPAAPAHLRHRLGVGQGAGRAPPPAGGGRAPRPPQARRRARPVLLPRGDRLGAGRVPPQGRHRPPADGGLLADQRHEAAGYEFVDHPAHHQGRPLRDLRATSTGSPRACSRPWSSTAGRRTT